MRTSRIEGFYKLDIDNRLELVKTFCGLEKDEINLLKEEGIPLEDADRLIENVIGKMEIPLGIAVNFLINGKEVLIPMAIEETSVVAAASNAAKIARVKGGFFTQSTDPVMIGQIQLTGVKDPYNAKMTILSQKERFLEIANEKDPILVKFGGGARDIEVRIIDTPVGKMVITHLLVDCRDAMGANAVNTMAETIAPLIESITGGKVYLRIISNLATKRIARARAIFSKDALGGEEVVEGILQAYAFAFGDPFRATTHNKGIMNGIIAVALATGNDTRALEAGAHSYACITGKYLPLTTWERNEDGDLVGTIELPLAVGIVGGATRAHPVARTSLKILEIKTANELAEIMAAVGLAQNLAALRALATEGIQKGHMSLHAKNIAIMAGAKGDLIDKIAEIMVKEKKIRIDRAEELMKEFS